jgi:Tol biopolymer transport system component
LTAPGPNTWGDGGLALSPDTKTLAFTENSGFWACYLYVVPVSSDLLFMGKPRRISIDRKDIGGLAWTGDGKSLVFSSGRNGKTELWRIRPEPGSNPVRVALTADDVTDLAISRDGKRLVYARDLEDSNIWRASLKGEHVTGPAKLVASMRKDIQARYSPDGKRIVFESNRSGTEEIWTCNADGTNANQLTYFGNAWAGTPTWSPDGKDIAFSANADRTWDIYIVSSEGGNPRRLTDNRADENWPVWSRDGQWVYYWSNRAGQGQVWRMQAAGGPETQITTDGAYWSNISPDGKYLYYMNEQGLWRTPATGGKEIKVANSETFVPGKNGVYYVDRSDELRSSFHLLFWDSKTQRTRTIGLLPGPVSSWNIEISPNERTLLYSKYDRQGSELMLVDDFR